MYVIPSVMVQSYICYVTKPIVYCPILLLFFIFSTKDWEAKGQKGKGQCFDCAIEDTTLAQRQ